MRDGRKGFTLLAALAIAVMATIGLIGCAESATEPEAVAEATILGTVTGLELEGVTVKLEGEGATATPTATGYYSFGAKPVQDWTEVLSDGSGERCRAPAATHEGKATLVDFDLATSEAVVTYDYGLLTENRTGHAC